ncbi:unnamed protein product [Mytilus coruscus]|uniref:Reverse transcriptase domain-containing protein n=1 Tax=Mytilus coruscus TaxID=42192 RepID=A0A6J8BUY5_MYTCO|nr:unnamed protein product [Mytilus coruscus]
MPNNRKQAEQRLIALSKRFTQDHDFHKQYVTFMDKVPEKDNGQNDGSIWYLPHHGVFHPKKSKLRVVFDCAARFKGTSLNDQLLQGPNLTYTLIGTLVRFRQEEIAIMGDIDSMFYQVRVPSHDSNFLRFLWWENGDHSKQPVEYKMVVHLFDRALGVQWCVDSDEFRFNIDVKDKPATRRGILSITSSVFDPLGFLAPFTLVGNSTRSSVLDGTMQSHKHYLKSGLNGFVTLKKLSEFKVN